MNITYYGHACFLVEFGGKKLLFDPFISYNPLCAAAGVKAVKYNLDYKNDDLVYELFAESNVALEQF